MYRSKEDYDQFLKKAFLNRELIDACSYGQSENVIKLLKDGADANACNGTPLIYASMNGHTSTVEALIAGGADVHMRDGEALKAAYNRGRTETGVVIRLAMVTNDPALSAKLAPYFR